jgi:hypothetical protein
MSSLLDSSAGLARRPGGSDVPPSPLGAACLAAGRATGTGLLPVLVPVVLAWVLGAGGTATWSQTLRFAVGLWLLGHHAGLVVSGGHVGLVPLGMILAPALACFFAGRRLARTLDARADRIEAGATRAAPAALSWRVLVLFAGVYCVLAVLASMAAGMPGLRPVSGQALVGAALVSLCCGGLGAAAYRHSGARAGVRAIVGRVPAAVRPALRAALGALSFWVCGGAVLVAVMIVTHFAGVTSLYRALDTGVVGGAVLTLAQLALLPNLVLWGCAVTAGPGIVVGTGATVTVGVSQLGPLPAVPLLAALPAPGRLPAEAAALLLLPLLAGAVAGVLVLVPRRPAPRRPAPRRPAPTLVARLVEVVGAGVACAVAAGLLAWLSGGPAGPGRLADVGPDPLSTGLAFGIEVVTGGGAVVLVSGLLPGVVGTARTRIDGARRAAGDRVTRP